MRAKQWTRWVGVLLTLTIGTVAQAATWIEDFEGTPEAYRLKRDDQELPVKIYQTLQPGDRLWVLEAGHSLWLRRDDGSEVIISQKNSPYRVEVVGKAPGRWANLFAWASDWLTGQLNEGATRSVVSVVTRGEIPPITLPLIAEEPARLVAGRRPLHLAWRGGYPPFRVRLVAEEGERVVLDRQGIELEGNQEWRFSTALLEWVPGRYLLTIDDGWRQAEVALMVVPEEQLPAPPEELAGGVENNVRETLYALWLAAQGEEWLLEAYQRAVGLAERHPPAEILMQSLEQDQQPPLPARAEASEGASPPLPAAPGAPRAEG